MENLPTYYEDLITRYLSGEATPKEVKELEEWVEADAAHRKIFTAFHKTWLAVEKDRIDRIVNVDEEWAAVAPWLREEKPAATTKPRYIPLPFVAMRSMRFEWNYRVAALIVLLLVPLFFLVRYAMKPEMKELTASTGVTESVLPDGSAITLNQGSVLSYPASFRGDKRPVTLDGEAFFVVSHSKEKPFIVTSGNLRVKVMGTRFYVNTHAGEQNMEVVLESGKVALYFDDNPEAARVLAPGERATVQSGNKSIEITVNGDPNFLAWKTRTLIFNNDRLDKVAALIGKVYHTQVTLAEPGLAKCTLTATFSNQSLESVIKVVEATLGITSRKTATGIEFSGKSCE
jgi:transmembrane sensor